MKLPDLGQMRSGFCCEAQMQRNGGVATIHYLRRSFEEALEHDLEPIVKALRS